MHWYTDKQDIYFTLASNGPINTNFKGVTRLIHVRSFLVTEFFKLKRCPNQIFSKMCDHIQRGSGVQVDKAVCGSTQGSSTLVWRNKRVIPWKWLVLFQTWWLRLWKMAPIFPLDISWLKPHTNNFQHFYFFHAPTNQPARSRRIHVGHRMRELYFLRAQKSIVLIWGKSQVCRPLSV